MATKLQIYKSAELHLGQRTITALTDDVESRHVFDAAWDGVIDEAFNAGDWNFAKKTVALSESGTGTASAGWEYVFDYPDDYVRTIAVSPYAGFNDPFTGYIDEDGYLHSGMQSVYLRYISNAKVDDPTMWPAMFARYVGYLLAQETCEKITSSGTTSELMMKQTERALRKAKSVDARNENGKRIYRGSWLRARHGYGTDAGGEPGHVIGGEITLGEGDV